MIAIRPARGNLFRLEPSTDSGARGATEGPAAVDGTGLSTVPMSASASRFRFLRCSPGSPPTTDAREELPARRASVGNCRGLAFGGDRHHRRGGPGGDDRRGQVTIDVEVLVEVDVEVAGDDGGGDAAKRPDARRAILRAGWPQGGIIPPRSRSSTTRPHRWPIPRRRPRGGARHRGCRLVEERVIPRAGADDGTLIRATLRGEPAGQYHSLGLLPGCQCANGARP